jgi:hypothetical protein
MERQAGKGQDVILEVLKRRGEPVALTDIARSARGIHFKELMNAMRVLVQKGIVTRTVNPTEGDVLELVPGKSASSVLASKVAELRRVVAELRRVASPTKDWGDDDRSAPKTIWGPAQYAYEIAPGVVWFGTAGHGGLRVAPGVAKKKLSPAAIKLAEKGGGSLWYEEDVLFAIPFYENPEWGIRFDRLAGGRSGTKQELEQSIRSYFPQYFKMLEENFSLPEAPKVGDKMLILKDIPYRTTLIVPEGETVPILEVKRTGVVYGWRGQRFRLSFEWIDNGYAKVLKQGQRTAALGDITKELPGGWVLTWNPNRPKTVYVDGDNWSDSALRYPNGKIVYDFPERIPDVVKAAVSKFFVNAKRQYSKMLAER